MQRLIETHLNYSSLETIDNAYRICETHLYKGDIFSFGCILYEMTFLKAAFENKFSNSNEVFNKLNQKINNNLKNYSNDLKDLMKLTMKTNPEERLNINEIFRLDFIQDKLQNDYSSAYKQQVIPSLALNSKFDNVLECIKAKIDSDYRPNSMKILKYNQNLIVIVANKHVNRNRNRSLLVTTYNYISSLTTKTDQFDNEESKIIIYDSFGQFYQEFNSFIVNEYLNNREFFNFEMSDLCVDEENDHLYLSTSKHGILRFEIVKKNYYFEDLILNGRLDLSELFKNFYPSCLNLIENESVFSDSMKTTNKRRLIFNDRLSKRIISIQIDLKIVNNTTTLADKLINNLIKCNINAGLTLDQQHVRQMVSTDNELICLFDDLNLVNAYDLKTLVLKRTNNLKNNLSVNNYLFCLAIDSFNNVYSTDGECIFNLDSNNELKRKKSKKLKVFVDNEFKKLSHNIVMMSLMTNLKLVLLTDALQTEHSLLYILNPVCKSIAELKPEI
jgi:hypothetical protein